MKVPRYSRYQTYLRWGEIYPGDGWKGDSPPTIPNKTILRDMPILDASKNVVMRGDIVVYPLFSRKGRKPHRVFILCRVCGKEIPLGRIAQHMTVHAG